MTIAERRAQSVPLRKIADHLNGMEVRRLPPSMLVPEGMRSILDPLSGSGTLTGGKKSVPCYARSSCKRCVPSGMMRCSSCALAEPVLVRSVKWIVCGWRSLGAWKTRAPSSGRIAHTKFVAEISR